MRRASSGWWRRLYPPAATAARRLALPLLAGGAGLLLLLPMPGLPGMAAAGRLGFAAFLMAAFRTLDPVERGQIGSLIRHPALLLRPEAAMTPIAINGRFLTQRVTGVQRFATEITHALDAMAAEGPLPGACLLRPARRAALPLPASGRGGFRAAARAGLGTA